MSLALVQGYSSEEDEQRLPADSYSEGSEEETEVLLPDVPSKPQPAGPLRPTSLLPSPTDVFAEVTGPPEFLKSGATEQIAYLPLSQRPSSATIYSLLEHSTGYPAANESQERRPPPTGAVLEARAQLVGVHDHVHDTSQEGARRAPGAGFPPLEDAANLLRMCLKCGVPKTYSGLKEGMVCPVCRDRPAVLEDSSAKGGEKKRGSKIKDKEHSKRMKGQSTHSSWKSETEMQLRQQFD